MKKPYLNRLSEYISAIDLKEIDELKDILITASNNNNKVFVAGNGGSASTANHMVADLLSLESKIGFRLKVISLCSNDSVITQIGNDDSFDNIFMRQINCLGSEGDILLVISASGNSKNLISGVNLANQLNMQTIALLGFDGGALKNIVSRFILIKTEVGDYGPVEDVHLMLNHMLKEFILNEFSSISGSRS